MDSEKSFEETDSLTATEVEDVPVIAARKNPWKSRPAIALAVVVALQTVLLVALSLHSDLRGCRDPSLALWSPVNDDVRYKTVTFEAHFMHRSPYLSGSREQLDNMWLQLYDFGTSGLTEAEASKLLNKTLPAPLDPDVYLVELQVFHDLHCLNMVRKAAHPEMYPDAFPRSTDKLHLDHCIDSLRQTLMCTADVTPVRFHHNTEDPGHIFPAIYATHTCRDYGAITAWAKKKQVPMRILGFDQS